MYQSHHLVPTQVYNGTPWLRDLARAGLYNQNSAQSLQDLPTAPDGSSASIHNGGDGAHIRYTQWVQNVADAIGIEQGKISNNGQNSADAIREAQIFGQASAKVLDDYLRQQLLNGQLPLNRYDPKFSNIDGTTGPLNDATLDQMYGNANANIPALLASPQWSLDIAKYIAKAQASNSSPFTISNPIGNVEAFPIGDSKGIILVTPVTDPLPELPGFSMAMLYLTYPTVGGSFRS